VGDDLSVVVVLDFLCFFFIAFFFFLIFLVCVRVFDASCFFLLGCD